MVCRLFCVLYVNKKFKNHYTEVSFPPLSAEIKTLGDTLSPGSSWLLGTVWNPRTVGLPRRFTLQVVLPVGMSVVTVVSALEQAVSHQLLRSRSGACDGQWCQVVAQCEERLCVLT